MVSFWPAPMRVSAPSVGTSSVTIVPVALLVIRNIPALRLLSVTVKPLSASIKLSPATSTVMVLLVSPYAKVNVPEGSVLSAKSAALAGLLPDPVTAQDTVCSPSKSPERVAVKVKAVVPDWPSYFEALDASIETLALTFPTVMATFCAALLNWPSKAVTVMS